MLSCWPKRKVFKLAFHVRKIPTADFFGFLSFWFFYCLCETLPWHIPHWSSTFKVSQRLNRFTTNIRPYQQISTGGQETPQAINTSITLDGGCPANREMFFTVYLWGCKFDKHRIPFRWLTIAIEVNVNTRKNDGTKNRLQQGVPKRQQESDELSFTRDTSDQ